MVKITVDGKKLETEEHLTVLEACLQNGIFIPNLCFLKTRPHPHASCRLCFVSIEGYDRPITACTERVRDGLVVKTDTPEVRALQRSAFKLLMSLHPCNAKLCPTEKPCLLMRIAKHIGVGINPKPLERINRGLPDFVDFGSLYYVPNRCVLCARCIHTCRSINKRPLLTFAKRGIMTMVAYFSSGNDSEVCSNCNACVDICPVAALLPKSAFINFLEAKETHA
ncbi:MAG: 2Fe-2S iron-sulfur cluster-binding protein [Syntrophobacterales bacterium]|nr:2Fe-2S iron-sulfur cluster-binding protein [Syntrophobacterales bacterium]